MSNSIPIELTYKQKCKINNSSILVASDENNFTPGYKENLFISVGMMDMCMHMRTGTLHRIISFVCVYKMCI